MTGHPDLALSGGATALLLVGCALLAAALAWRYVRGMGVRHRIRQALGDPDADVRRHGITLAADRGLAWAAELLLRTARDEQDPAVLAELVHAVARRQWEPASTPRIVELRLWAKAYVETHEELQADYETALVSGRREERTFGDRPARRASDASDTDLAAIGAVPARRSGRPDGVRVLVTGAGGAAGVAVIRDLVRHGHHVVAVDADPSAVGLRLAHDGHAVPPAADASFADELHRIATATGVQALMCTVAEEYAALVPALDRFTAAGVETLVPPLGAVEACIDKWRFAEVAAEHDLPVPPTALGAAGAVPGPWIVKPRHGRGSRHVHAAADKRQLQAALRHTPDPVVQQRLTGREFTADALVDADGAVVAVVPRWRLETKAGISTKGRTFDDPLVVAAVERVLGALGLVGPANVQGFVADDGDVRVHEVNPRFSGGLPLSLHAGADLVEEYLRMILGQPARGERLRARSGVTMFRHFAEVYDG